MARVIERDIRRVEERAPDPDEKVVEAALRSQRESRFVMLPNAVIDGAFGVWDTEFELWIATPFYSEVDAEELRRRAKARD